MKKKSEITVREASELVFNLMPETFSAVKFCRNVRKLTGRDSLMDGTTLRKLREARAEKSDKYDYECIDREMSMYRKISYQNV